MKRVGLIGVCFGMILLLTGCGNEVELTCTMEESASYVTSTQQYHFVYADEELVTMDQGVMIEVDDSYSYMNSYLSNLTEDFEEESDSDVESYEENNVELTKEHNSHEDELLSIKLAISKKSEVKLYNGIRNIGRSCYFNVIVQLLVYLPNLESYILSEDEILPSQKEFYSFLLRIISQVKCSTSTVSISNTLLTPNIRSCISSPYGGAPTALLWDILNPTSVAVKQNGKENLFVTIDPKHSFAENIKSIFPESIKNILFVYRDTDVDGSKFMFPDSFRYQTHNMVLRFIITHPHDHFVGYLKLYTGTFIEFNDSRVSEVSEINPFETLLALYIRS